MDSLKLQQFGNQSAIGIGSIGSSGVNYLNAVAGTQSYAANALTGSAR